ncbi:MAG: metal ABC transporter permease, partial [Sphingomonas bacterium]|nr:metal ABC transporter permease [Sphingomonas bacterium]
MMDTTFDELPKDKGSFAVLWRFLPMLWPKDDAGLRFRVVVAVVLVMAAKAITLVMPFAYKAVVDAMSARTAPFGAVAMLVVAYA